MKNWILTDLHHFRSFKLVCSIRIRPVAKGVPSCLLYSKVTPWKMRFVCLVSIETKTADLMVITPSSPDFVSIRFIYRAYSRAGMYEIAYIQLYLAKTFCLDCDVPLNL